MIRSIKRNGNDALNRCRYSSQWNLRPLASTTSFFQQQGEKRGHSRSFSICFHLGDGLSRLRPGPSRGIALSLIRCSIFSSFPSLLLLYVPLLRPLAPRAKQACEGLSSGLKKNRACMTIKCNLKKKKSVVHSTQWDVTCKTLYAYTHFTTPTMSLRQD